ncbi:DNA cytosine methyltransferase [Chenggangzhangella methanolivorans]|nr:DNA cytosine methyltransferase [Chenggangzhangella methanolivorans]
MIRYLSVCSGIEAASVAWEPLGWTPVAFSEIEPFPSAVLAHHWPHVPNLGDFTTIDVDALPEVDLLVGGTPCQAFSVAGARRSLADARGNLSLAYVDLAHALAARRSLRMAVWENVPGVLSTADNAFGCFLGALVGADDALPQPFGGRWPDAGLASGPRARAAWRVLDAQYFGLAQRRRRVFVVVDLGGGADPAAVLFEPAGLRRHPPSRGETGQDLAPTLGARASRSSTTDFDLDGGLIAKPLLAGGHGNNPLDENLVVFDTTQITSGENRSNPRPGDPCHTLSGEGHPPALACIPIAESGKRTGASSTDLKAGDGIGRDGDPMFTLSTDSRHAVAFSLRGREGGAVPEVSSDGLAPTVRTPGGGASHTFVAQAWGLRNDARDGEAKTPSLDAEGRERLRDAGFNVLEECAPTLDTGAAHSVGSASGVRRLTPVECARLQGFADDHAAIVYRGKPAADGPQYKVFGNSKAVYAVRWLGGRIAMHWPQALREAAE